MKYSNEKVAGVLLFVGTVQFLLALIVAEAMYAGYSISENYISDLGVGPSAVIFNSSVFFLGLMIVIGAYFIWRGVNSKLLFVFLVLAGLGAMGVGLFTEDAGAIHSVVSLITFLFGGLSAIASYRLQRMPMSLFAVFLGLMTFAALVLFISGSYSSVYYLGLDKGGMERMIVYPVLLWGVAFGGHLANQSGDKASTAKNTA
jgi:hypothetical membrane protein